MSHLQMTEAEYAAYLKKRKGKKQPEVEGPPPPMRRAVTDWPRVLARQIANTKSLPMPILEYAFDKQLEGTGRAWRFDLCWPDVLIGLEVDGGAHAIRAQLEKDIEKYAGAFKLGYRVLRVSPEQVQSGLALKLVKEAFER